MCRWRKRKTRISHKNDLRMHQRILVNVANTEPTRRLSYVSRPHVSVAIESAPASNLIAKYGTASNQLYGSTCYGRAALDEIYS